MGATELRRRSRPTVLSDTSVANKYACDDAEDSTCTDSGSISQGVGYALTQRVVSHHNSLNDAWVTYRGGVFDVTTFLDAHPGGAEVVEPYLGGDVEHAMGAGGPHEHSPFAIKLLEKYRIGTLIDSTAGTVVCEGNVDPVTGKQLVVWDQPILHQVGLLGDRYMHWIHSFPTTDHTVKMFTNDTVENLTKCPWYVPLVFWIPCIIAEVFHFVALMGGWQNIHAFWSALCALAGGLFWLLFEYSLHRYVFHWHTSRYYSNIVHFLIHGHHHITPMDFDRLVFPPVPALIFGGPFWFLAPRILGIEAGYPWLLGFVLGYLTYDMTHFWIHHGVPKNRFLRNQKRRHVHHHYFKPSVNFGISNPLFDVVFGTLVEPQ